MPYFIFWPSNRPRLQRLACAELRASIINDFKEASRQHKEIESRMEVLKLFLEENADFLGDLDSSHEN